MTSASSKRVCAKCNKGAGTAMCYGCEQSFCTKHFIEHRQELAHQMECIGQEHDLLQRDLTHDHSAHGLLARIDRWEQESISKIQIAAQTARTTLQQILNRPKNNLQGSMSKVTEELQTSRELDDYTELDIKKWTEQLQEFRMALDQPINLQVDFEKDSRSAIRLLRVAEPQALDTLSSLASSHDTSTWTSQSSEPALTERFEDIFGKVTLSEGGLVATCLGGHADRSCVAGTGRYSTGVHYIHFRIEQTSTHYHSFFGIINAGEKMTYDLWNSTSFHGWWDLDYNVISGKSNRRLSPETIRMGDEVTLMLDCINRRMQLEHHRTNRTVTMPIDVELCPFPWKIIVLLLGKDDCVRILY